MSSQIKCPECGAPMVLRTTTRFLTRDGQPRKFYGCSKYPNCHATHGAHPDGRPLGIPGDSDTKVLRQRAHQYMDSWKEKNGYSKGKAYAMLAAEFGVTVHIGELSLRGCHALIEWFRIQGVDLDPMKGIMA